MSSEPRAAVHWRAALISLLDDNGGRRTTVDCTSRNESVPGEHHFDV